MKQLIFVFALIMGTSISAGAQNAHPQVIAILAKASWCQVCKANGPRFEKDVMPMIMKNKNVKMVMNDLSNESSKTMSKEMLEKAGVYKFAEENPATGMLYFLNAKTKKLISVVSLANTNEQIEEAFKTALAKS